MKQHIFLGGVLVLLLLSCNKNNSSNDDKSAISEKNILDNETTEITKVSISDSLIQTLNSIPSPIETAFQIKENGGEFNANFLNPSDKFDQYESSSVLALNLGIYSADLAYCNIYENKDATKYLGAVYEVSKPLGLESHFDFEGMMNLMKNDHSNLDSMLQITTEKFEDINKELQEENKSHFSVLMLVGGWIEGLHLLTSVYELNPSQPIKERIGEQKIVLSQLIGLVKFYKDKDDTILNVFNHLTHLSATYEGIKIMRSSNEEVEIVMDTELNIPVAIPKGTSMIIISDSEINEIIKNLNHIRTYIINKN